MSVGLNQNGNGQAVHQKHTQNNQCFSYTVVSPIMFVDLSKIYLRYICHKSTERFRTGHRRLLVGRVGAIDESGRNQNKLGYITPVQHVINIYNYGHIYIYMHIDLAHWNCTLRHSSPTRTRDPACNFSKRSESVDWIRMGRCLRDCQGATPKFDRGSSFPFVDGYRHIPQKSLFSDTVI